MTIKETFPMPSRESFAHHHLPKFNRDKDTQAMWWFTMINDSMCRYKDSGRYAEGSWGYTGKSAIASRIRQGIDYTTLNKSI